MRGLLFNRVPFLLLSLFLIIGVLVSSCFSISFSYYYFLIPAISLIISLFFYHRRREFFFFFLVLASFSHGAVFGLYKQTEPLRIQIETKKNDTFAGYIISDPQYKSNEGFLKWEYPYKSKFVVSVKEIHGRKMDFKVMVHFNTRAPFLLEQGDQVSFTGYIFAPYPVSNPHQFDYANYLAQDSIFYMVSVRGKENLTKRSGLNFCSIRRQIRNYLSERLTAYVMPKSLAGLLKGMILGDHRFIEDLVKESFKQTNTMHILAISGLHLGMIAFIVLSFLKWVIRNRRARYSIAAIVLVGYALLVGLRPPIVRTLIMVLVFLIGKIIYREGNILNSLSLAAFIILLFSPLELYRVGFLLSFVIVFSIVLLTPVIEDFFNKYLSSGQKNKWMLGYPIRFFSACLAAQIGSMPIIAYHYHMVSLVSLIANICVILLLYPIILFGFLAMGIGIFFPGGLAVVNPINAKILYYLTVITTSLSKIPFAYVYVPQLPLWSIFICYSGIALFFKTKWKRIAIFLLFLVCCFVVVAWWWRVRQPKVVFFDVGKGDSAFVQFEGGKNLLVDCGSSSRGDVGKWVVLPYLRGEGIYTLNQVVLSHFHKDHVNGLFTLMDEVKIESLLIPKETNRLELEDAILEKAKAKHIKVIKVDDQAALGDNKVIVLSPSSDPFLFSNEHRTANENSVVVKVLVSGMNILFSGDVEQSGIDYLISKKDALKSAICKVPHHGGKSSVKSLFYRYVDCKDAVVSTNRLRNNGITNCLEGQGIAIWQTNTYGAISFLMADNAYRVQVIKKPAS